MLSDLSSVNLQKFYLKKFILRDHSTVLFFFGQAAERAIHQLSAKGSWPADKYRARRKRRYCSAPFADQRLFYTGDSVCSPSPVRGREAVEHSPTPVYFATVIAGCAKGTYKSYIKHSILSQEAELWPPKEFLINCGCFYMYLSCTELANSVLWLVTRGCSEPRFFWSLPERLETSRPDDLLYIFCFAGVLSSPGNGSLAGFSRTDCTPCLLWSSASRWWACEDKMKLGLHTQRFLVSNALGNPLKLSSLHLSQQCILRKLGHLPLQNFVSTDLCIVLPGRMVMVYQRLLVAHSDFTLLKISRSKQT